MSEKIDLALKYRPTTFDEVIGNDAQITAVKDALKHGSHVFLFTGPGGCGKTTMARICATEIGASDFNILELNSAENRGIDTAREIMEAVRFKSIDGTPRVWVLDEMHRLTGAAMDAFLKVLEEPPSYVYFFLCTTEPQKLTTPLKTRCTIINMKSLDENDMRKLLKRVMQAEERKISSDILIRIIDMAEGSSRRALKLLTKVLWQDDENKQIEILEADDGEGSAEGILLCRVLIDLKSKWADVAQVLEKMDLSDAEAIRRQVLGYACSVIMKGKTHPRAIAMLEAFESANTFVGKGAIALACLRVVS